MILRAVCPPRVQFVQTDVPLFFVIFGRIYQWEICKIILSLNIEKKDYKGKKEGKVRQYVH
jgi:hypothetical protein